MDSHLKLGNDIGTPLSLEDVVSYRKRIGKLIYFNNTRLDIAFPFSNSVSFSLNLLTYIKSTPGKGLFFSSSFTMHFKAFSDADWAGCINSRRPIPSFSIYLGESLINWKSKKQITISISSFEVEYKAFTSVTYKIQWLVYLIGDIQISHKLPVCLYHDNQFALHIVANSTFYKRTKYIELNCHIVREKVSI